MFSRVIVAALVALPMIALVSGSMRTAMHFYVYESLPQ